MNDEDRYKPRSSFALREETETTRRVERKKRSKKHEKRVAKELGGRRQPGSGSMEGAKGDLKTEYALCDHKFTDKLSYTITQETLVKLVKETQEEGKRVPILMIKFDKPVQELKWLNQTEWALIPSELLKEVLGSK